MMGNFYLCAKEGVYKIDPHEHKTKEEAADCTQKWAIKLALDRDKWKRSCERWIEMANAEGYVARALRKAAEALAHEIETDEGVSTEDWPLLDGIKEAIALKPSQVEKTVAELLALETDVRERKDPLALKGRLEAIDAARKEE